jgi:hypothetical protein
MSNTLSKEEMEKLIRPTSYHRLFEVRAGLPVDGEPSDEMVLEGKAVVYEEKATLFTLDNGMKVCEIVKRGAFQGCDFHDCFFRYNHSDDVMVMARGGKGLTFIDTQESLNFRAVLDPISVSHDLFTSVKCGTLSEMSWAFRRDDTDEVIDQSIPGEITFVVNKIRKLYDVAAVPFAAYGNTELYARRRGDAETILARAETLKQEQECRRLRIIGLGYLGQKIDDPKK